MKWIKKGLIFSTDNNNPWMRSHATNMVAQHLENDMFRVFFSCRNERNVSSIGFVDLDLKPPYRVTAISEHPVLTPGEAGGFDDSGVSLGCIVSMSDKKFIYYVGWNLGVTVPWRNTIGLAVSDASGTHFEKVSRAPIMDRSHEDPFSLSYPWVLYDGGVFRMWYGSNLSWGREEKDMKHVIKYAESHDGISWQRTGVIAINFKNESEYAIARPCVVREKGIYKMWYACRGISYRIGYAESRDGISWMRKDEDVGIDVSASGWDSEMICYPAVFDHGGQRYMLYNGNGYGKTGFGLAVLDEM
jgi:predicted GH43/DUF377 family glycosyl hydrolase